MISRENMAKICQWFKRKSFVICCGIAPVILLSALLFNCNFGYNVIVNNEILGTAPSKEYVNNLICSINEELAPYLGGDAITVEPAMTPKIVIGKDFSTSQELGEALKSFCPYLEKAYSIKSNGKTVVAFKTEKERKNCYDTFISNTTKDSTSYEILDTVTFEYELVPYGLIKSGSNAVSMLKRTYNFSETVELNEDCTLSDIIVAYAITKEDFLKLNPGYSEGQTRKAKINSNIPYIRVLCKKEYTENKVLRHKIKYENDSSLLKGKSKMKTEGKDGFEKTEKTRYILNGNVIYDEKGKTTLEDSKTEVVLVGTKEAEIGTGNMSNPCKGKGTLSSRYGSRNGRMHKGIDICGPEGTDITAADSGTVVFSGWDNGGYGYVVKIDHGNGYETLYAHCKSLYVTEGSSVKKGDVIASMGNTGRSTGPHLHFEVINTKNGSNIDPLKLFNLS